MITFVFLQQDPRFNREIDVKTGYKTRSILAMPIKDLDGEVIGVAMAINKLATKDQAFDEHDEKVKLTLWLVLTKYWCKVNYLAGSVCTACLK